MNKNHTFSIIAYQESPHLQECVDSLRNQKASSEIILCTSTPSEFLNNVAIRNGLQLHINPERSDIAADWNFALSKATTKYVTLAHQDDIYFPGYTEEIIRNAETQKDALIIFSNYDELVCKNNQTCIRKNSLNFFIKNIMNKLFFRNKNYIVKNKQRLLSFGNPIGCPTVAFNKSNIGNFQFDRSFGINMDWKAWLDLAQKAGSFVRVKEILMSHRIYAESETSRGLAENRRQEEDKKIFARIWPSFLASILAKMYSLSYKNNK